MEDEEILECPVCMEPYDEGKRTPKMMACLHTICIACVINLAGGIPNTRGQVSGSSEPALPKGKTCMCPLCQENIATDRIQTNRYVLAQIKDLQRLQGLQLGEQYLRQPIPSPRDQLHQISQEEHPQSYLHDIRDPYHEPQPAENPYYVPSNIRKNRDPEPPIGPITTLVTKTTKKTPPKLILCRSSNVHADTAATTPVAGCVPIYPKLPPATTFYQRNPSQEPSRGIMRVLSNDTPSIPEDNNISPVSLPPSDTEKTETPLISPSAPPNQTDLSDMWCRTCEEPAMVTCTRHNLVLLLNEDQVDWIQQEKRPMLEKPQLGMRDDDLSTAMSRSSLNASPASLGVNDAASRQGVENCEVQSTPDLNKLTYPEIRDTINTSCDPDFVMNCYKELDRRRIEYHRTIKRKEMELLMAFKK